MSKKCGKFILKNDKWINNECHGCCSDCSGYCGLDCPFDIDNSCERCEFKNGFKKPYY